VTYEIAKLICAKTHLERHAGGDAIVHGGGVGLRLTPGAPPWQEPVQTERPRYINPSPPRGPRAPRSRGAGEGWSSHVHSPRHGVRLRHSLNLGGFLVKT